MNIDELKTKTAHEMIMETESIDMVLDTIIEYIKILEERIKTLENN